MSNINSVKIWEYCIVKYSLIGVGNTQEIRQVYVDGKELNEWNKKPLRMFLNHLGTEGWEMVGVYNEPPETMLYFKRPT